LSNLGRTVKYLLDSFIAVLVFPLVCSATDYFVDNTNPRASDANEGSSTDLPWSTIGKAASTMVAGDTCHVLAGTYDERVLHSTDGSPDNRIVYLGSTPQPIVRGFSIEGDYVTIDNFEVTSVGMIPEYDRSIVVNGGTGIEVLNSYVHDTTHYQGIISSASFAVFRGNTISYCGEAMSIVGTNAGPKSITAGVNDQVRFSVQGGESQTITMPEGDFDTHHLHLIQEGANPQMSGATFEFGSDGKSELRSSTTGPASTITLEPVTNNAYATFGWALGPGTMQGLYAAFAVSSNDILIEDNKVSNVGDYVATGEFTSRLVVRNNTFGPADPHSAQHVDGIQSGKFGLQKLLFEGNRFTENANGDNHAVLLQGAADIILIIRYNSIYQSNGQFDLSRGNNRTDHGAYLYNNTSYDNANFIASGNVQVYSGETSRGDYSLNNHARNNIWFNSSVFNPYEYSDDIIDKDYDLWFAGTGDPREVNGTNEDPLFVDGPSGEFKLQRSSPARDRGGPLTRVQAADTGSGTILRVENSSAFQDGWAGVQKDWISVGTATNSVQISAIDYSANLITLASSIERSVGDPVWLFKNSRGQQVLFGSAPDIGAFEYVPATPPLELSNVTRSASGEVHFGFTNSPGASFVVLASTNLFSPPSSWIPVGSPVEAQLGHFQFIDTGGTNLSRRFYHVQSP